MEKEMLPTKNRLSQLIKMLRKSQKEMAVSVAYQRPR